MIKMKVELYDNVARVWVDGVLISIYFAMSMMKESMLILFASNNEFITSFDLKDVHDMRE